MRIKIGYIAPYHQDFTPSYIIYYKEKFYNLIWNEINIKGDSKDLENALQDLKRRVYEMNDLKKKYQKELR